MRMKRVCDMPARHSAIRRRTNEESSWPQHPTALAQESALIPYVFNRFEGNHNVHRAVGQSYLGGVTLEKFAVRVSATCVFDSFLADVKTVAAPRPCRDKVMCPDSCSASHIQHLFVLHEAASEDVSLFVLAKQRLLCRTGHDALAREFQVWCRRKPCFPSIL